MPFVSLISRCHKRSSTHGGTFALAIAGTLALTLAPATVRAAKPPADLSRLVVVGDSLSAGFQNFSLFDGATAPLPFAGGQTYAYPALVATQAGMIANFTLPLIRYPGIPPALTFDPATGQIRRADACPSPCSERESVSQPFNLSVPGFTLADALAHVYPGTPASNPIDALSDTVLGVPNPGAPGCGPVPAASPQVVSEVLCAIALRPTMLIVDIGNNDALQALTFGLQPTNTSVFAAEYHALMTSLAATGAPILVANIPDVTSIPFLTPVSKFYDRCGFVPTGATTSDYVVPDITKTSFGPCFNVVVRSGSLVSAAQSAVRAYNKIIAAEAKANGATLVDFNARFAQIAKDGGYQLPNKKFLSVLPPPTFPSGGLFSLDLIHPTITGQAILANEFIKAMTSAFSTTIQPVDLDAIAQIDPLVPPALKN